MGGQRLPIFISAQGPRREGRPLIKTVPGKKLSEMG